MEKRFSGLSSCKSKSIFSAKFQWVNVSGLSSCKSKVIFSSLALNSASIKTKICLINLTLRISALNTHFELRGFSLILKYFKN